MDSNFDALTPKSVVIRGLIDSAMKNLTGGVDYPRTVSVRDTEVTSASSPVRDLKSQQHSLVEDALVSPKKIKSLIPSVSEATEGSGAVGDRVGMESEEGKSKGRSWSKEFRPNLQCHADLIMQFWDAKAGAKSKAAWELLQTELTKIQEKYEDRALITQLELGAANRWKSVTLKNYESFGLNTPGKSFNGKSDPYDRSAVDWAAYDNLSFFPSTRSK